MSAPPIMETYVSWKLSAVTIVVLPQVMADSLKPPTPIPVL